jgi:carbon storage regulator
MLILTRKVDQAIVIQGDITVMILGVERDRVKIGIDAPEHVTVLREELVQDPPAESTPRPLRPRLVRPQPVATDGSLALKPKPRRV